MKIKFRVYFNKKNLPKNGHINIMFIKIIWFFTILKCTIILYINKNFILK